MFSYIDQEYIFSVQLEIDRASVHILYTLYILQFTKRLD